MVVGDISEAKKSWCLPMPHLRFVNIDAVQVNSI